MSARDKGETKMKTIRDVLTLIGTMLINADADTRAHAGGLLGPRRFGSTTERGIETLPLDTPIREIVPDVGVIPGCRYFRADGADVLALGPKLGAVPLALVKGAGFTPDLRLGRHGPEFVLSLIVSGSETHKALLSHLGAAVTPNYLTIILGPDGIIWTWFPGGALGTFDNETVETPTGLAFAFGAKGGTKIEALTPPIIALCEAHAAKNPDVGVKLTG